MKLTLKTFAMTLSLAALLFVGEAPDSPTGLTLVTEAEAVIGRPMTPVSYAGVARRSTRRAVYAGSAAAASSSAQQQQTTSQPAQAAGSLPIGATVSSLPSGCTAFTKDNVQYHTCGGNYYRAAFQGSNLVYSVVPRP